MKRFVILISVLILAFVSVASAQNNRRYSVEDLLKVRRVSDPQVSPDGRRVAFAVGDVNLDGNRVVNQIYVVSVGGGDAKQLTNPPARRARRAGPLMARRSLSQRAVRFG